MKDSETLDNNHCKAKEVEEIFSRVYIRTRQFQVYTTKNTANETSRTTAHK